MYRKCTKSYSEFTSIHKHKMLREGTAPRILSANSFCLKTLELGCIMINLYKVILPKLLHYIGKRPQKILDKNYDLMLVLG